MNNMGVFGWIRESVRRSVLLGFSDAVEQIGAFGRFQRTAQPAVRGDAPRRRAHGAGVIFRQSPRREVGPQASGPLVGTAPQSLAVSQPSRRDGLKSIQRCRHRDDKRRAVAACRRNSRRAEFQSKRLAGNDLRPRLAVTLPSGRSICIPWPAWFCVRPCGEQSQINSPAAGQNPRQIFATSLAQAACRTRGRRNSQAWLDRQRTLISRQESFPLRSSFCLTAGPFRAR